MGTSARPADRARPAPLQDLHPDCDTRGLHVAVESTIEDPVGVVVWDGPAWDDAVEGWGGETGWVDVAGDLFGFEYVAGREDASLGHHEASEFRFTLDNRSGRYSEFRTDGSGTIEPRYFFPGRQVAVWQEVDDVDYWRFFGRVARWDENLPTPESDLPTITVDAVDDFARLNTALDATEWRMGGEGDLPITRISNLLDFATWPSALRRLDRGRNTLRSVLTTNPILEELHHTAESDGGVVFVDVDGVFLYLDRDRVFGRVDQPVEVVISDSCAPGTITFVSADPIVDAEDVVNICRFENVDGANVRREDPESLAKYGPHPLSTDGMLWRSISDATALADYYLAHRADLYYRFDEIVLAPRYGAEDFAVACGLRVGDLITLERTMTDGGLLVTPLIIEGFIVRQQSRDGIWLWTIFVSKAGGSD